MKTVELTRLEEAVEALFDLATEDGVLLRLPDGKVFFLRSIANATDDDDDFADEVARTRQNSALMELLDARSQDQTRFTAKQARQRLGLEP